MPLLTRLLAVALLLGTALLGVGGVVHPVLAGDPAAQLRLIAATPHWRALHLAMLIGSGLVIAGIWVRLLDRAIISAPMLTALALVALGIGINALNIAFMAGGGGGTAGGVRGGGAPREPPCVPAPPP